MALQSQIKQIVDSTIQRFIMNVSKKLNVDSSTIEGIWNESQTAEESTRVSAPPPVATGSDSQNKDLSKLQKMKKDELKELCKNLDGYTARLTKVQLIDLYSKGSTSKNTSQSAPQPSKPPTKKLGLLDTSFLTVSPWKSDSSLLLHEQTGILLDTKSSKAVGCVDSNTGARRELTVDDLDTCKKYKIPYDVKGNLDSGSSSVSQVDELDEDDESEEEELVEEDMLLDEEDEEFEMEDES